MIESNPTPKSSEYDANTLLELKILYSNAEILFETTQIVEIKRELKKLIKQLEDQND